MKVEITEKDIDMGERESCTACPIALAVNRALKEQGHTSKFKAEVDTETLSIVDEEDTLFFFMDLNQETQKFVRFFDDGEIVFPFELDISTGTCLRGFTFKKEENNGKSQD